MSRNSIKSMRSFPANFSIHHRNLSDSTNLLGLGTAHPFEA